MRSWKKPTPKQIDAAVAQLGQAEHRRYFFDRLNNPEWIPALSQKHFFESPPSPIVDEDKGTILFPLWPQSRYLARMAALGPDAARTVLNEMLKIPDTGNVRVEYDLAEAALAMPAELAAKWVEKEANWVGGQERIYLMTLALRLGELVSHLSKWGESGADAALALSRALLDVLPDPRIGGKEADQLGEMFFQEPRARCGAWEYQQVLTKNIPDLVVAHGEKAFTLLCELLDRAINLSRRGDDEEKRADYSYVWCPMIERGIGTENNLKSMLVSAARDASEHLGQGGPAAVGQLVRQLEQRPCAVFHRLTLHLLRKFPKAAPELVEERLTRPADFDDPHFKREYSLLLRDQFANLSPEGEKKILDWIAAGPGRERAESWFKFVGREPTSENIRKFEDRWRWEKLSPICESLSGGWRDRWEKLASEFGKPADREYDSTMLVSRVGPTSPKSTQDLRSMTVPEIVAYLQDWEWDGKPESPSPEGLSTELTSVVAGEPANFAKGAERFTDVEEPTYIRGLVAGFARAAKDGKQFPWEPVLKLSNWAVRQTREIEGRLGKTFEIDPHWGWVRTEVARLLSEGFTKEKVDIPFNLRELAWDALQPITEDPYPSPEEEDSNLDPGTLSINSTRGEAMHAAVRYGLWVRRNLEKSADGKERVAKGLEEMRELRDVLEFHFDPAKDPSLAIHSVYGQWFPWLVYLDKQWARDHVRQVFSSDENSKKLLAAAWESFIFFCEPYDEVLEVLNEQYSRAINRIAPREDSKRHLGDPDERLGQHLIIFYGRGKLPLDDGDGFIQRFYAKADGRLRGAVTDFAGRSLKGPEDLPAAVVDRFKQLWLWRLNAIQRSADPLAHVSELSAFGTWLISGRFDDDWAMTQLLTVLRAIGKVELDMFVVERVATFAEKMPAEAVECIKHLIEGDKEGWAVLGWRDHARSILSSALKVGNEEVRQAAIDVINRLGARGHFEFRDLLPT